MKQTKLLMLIAILVFAASSAQAQIGKIKNVIKENTKTENTQKTSDAIEKSNKSNSDADYLFVGADDLEGEPTSKFKVCSDDTGSFENDLKTQFEQWFSDISRTAQEKMYAKGTCQLMGFRIVDNPSYKYRNVDSLETLAQGSSAYNVIGGKLALLKDFSANSMYVVVVPDIDKPGLKLIDLRLGVTPDLKATYRKKTAAVFNYHDLKQALYIFEKYKNYPGPYETNSVLFNSADFENLNKQGKFKGLIIYKLVGEDLEPMK